MTIKTEELCALANVAIETTLLRALSMLHPDKAWSSSHIKFIKNDVGDVVNIIVDFAVEEGEELIRHHINAAEVLEEQTTEFLKALSEPQLG